MKEFYEDYKMDGKNWENNQLDTFLEAMIAYTEDVDGYYIIAHPPQEKYLVDVPMWLVNLMQLCAGLKLQGKKVSLIAL